MADYRTDEVGDDIASSVRITDQWPGGRHKVGEGQYATATAVGHRPGGQRGRAGGHDGPDLELICNSVVDGADLGPHEQQIGLGGQGLFGIDDGQAPGGEFGSQLRASRSVDHGCTGIRAGGQTSSHRADSQKYGVRHRGGS